MASKLYGVNATIIIFVFVLYCIVLKYTVGPEHNKNERKEINSIIIIIIVMSIKIENNYFNDNIHFISLIDAYYSFFKYNYYKY